MEDKTDTRMALEAMNREEEIVLESFTIKKNCLNGSKDSPFANVLRSNCNSSILTLTGFTKEVILHLARLVRNVYRRSSPYGRINNCKVHNPDKGRRRELDEISAVGLVLVWYRTKCALWVLSLLFGCTTSVCSRYLRMTRGILLETVLMNHPLAEVVMPKVNEFINLNRMVCRKYDLLKDVYCTMDGLKLQIEKCTDNRKQRRFYNGWKHGHFVSNVFIFLTDGTIGAYAIGAPGTLHDSQLAHYGKLYKKLEKCYKSFLGVCVVDSAFALLDTKGISVKYLIKTPDQRLNGTLTGIEKKKHRQAVSFRQASEWGMKELQSVFPRLKEKLQYDDIGYYKEVVKCAVYLYNLRVRTVGINQIRNTFKLS